MFVMAQILCSVMCLCCVMKDWHIVAPRKMQDVDDLSSFEMVDSPADGDVSEAGENDIPSEPCDQTRAQQHVHFWQVEEWARLLNASLTPVEKNALMCVNLPERFQVDARKVVHNFVPTINLSRVHVLPCSFRDYSIRQRFLQVA